MQSEVSDLSEASTREALLSQFAGEWLCGVDKSRLQSEPEQPLDELHLKFSEWPLGESPLYLVKGIPPSQGLHKDWVIAAGIAHVFFLLLQKNQPLEKRAYDILMPLRGVFAQLVYGKLVGTHKSLLVFIDTLGGVHSQLTRWYEDLGAKGVRELQNIEDLIAPLIGVAVEDSVVEKTKNSWLAYDSQQQQRLRKLNERLRDMVSGSLANQECQERCCSILISAVAGRKLPRACAALIEGPWYDSLKYLYLNEGEKSSLWKRAVKITDTLLSSIFPEGHSVNAAIAEVSQILPGLLLSLRHDKDAQERYLNSLEEIYVNIMQGEPIIYDSTINLPNSIEDKYKNARVSETLIRKAKNFHPGDWLSFSGLREGRVQLLMVSEQSRCVVFSNQNGRKVFEFSMDEFAYQLANGSARALPKSNFVRVLLEKIIKQSRENHLVSLSLIEKQQSAAAKDLAREKSRKKAAAEAEYIRRQQSEAKLQYQREREKQASQLEALKAEKELLQKEKHRLEVENLVRDMGLGSWVSVKNGEDNLKLKLAVRLDSTKKLLFTNELGLGKKEYKTKEMVELILNQEIEVLSSLSNDNDSLAVFHNIQRRGSVKTL